MAVSIVRSNSAGITTVFITSFRRGMTVLIKFSPALHKRSNASTAWLSRLNPSLAVLYSRLVFAYCWTLSARTSCSWESCASRSFKRLCWASIIPISFFSFSSKSCDSARRAWSNAWRSSWSTSEALPTLRWLAFPLPSEPLSAPVCSSASASGSSTVVNWRPSSCKLTTSWFNSAGSASLPFCCCCSCQVTRAMILLSSCKLALAFPLIAK
mmetsp:Transcript_96497/g.242056  ORF Transcript_96497/g.242056 Transcript_96497/m.242056 type:complete len:212 (-) Transcript_96497:643-1278(-)